MEFVIVRCKGSKRVLIDGEDSGATNVELPVEEGNHFVSVPGCTPAQQEINVTGTLPTKPLEVFFKC